MDVDWLALICKLAVGDTGDELDRPMAPKQTEAELRKGDVFDDECETEGCSMLGTLESEAPA